MRIQVGRTMTGPLNICGIQVECPECQNNSTFNSVNVDTTSGGYSPVWCLPNLAQNL